MKTMPATQVAGIVIMGFVRGESRDQGSLDLVQLGFMRAEPAATGRPADDRADLLKLYLYGYLQQLRSSRRLEPECQRNVGLMWLLNRVAPDHKTIAEFRRREGAALRAVAAAFVRLCRGQGLIRGERLAIDGPKFEAVASRNAMLSRERLLREQAALDRRIAEYLEHLDAADAEEGESTIDAAAVREALQVLRCQQSQTAQGRRRLEALGATPWVASEPDAKRMKGHEPAYNVQTVVDAEHALIVTHEVTTEATDNTREGGFFDRTSFAYDQASDTLRRPAGPTLRRKQLQRGKHRVMYAAEIGNCGTCVLKACCTASPRRFVARHLHEAALLRLAEQRRW